MKNFEENLKRLDEIIADIEGNAVPLDAALALYKEGMALAADCAATITEIQKELEVLTDD